MTKKLLAFQPALAQPVLVTWNHAICKGERRALFALADELQYISCLLIMIEFLVARFASPSLEFKWPVLQIEKLISMHSADPTSESMASRSALRSVFEFHLRGTGVSGRSHVIQAPVTYDTEMTGASWSASKIWDYPNIKPTIFSYWSFTDKKQHIGKSSSISQEQNYWATCTHFPIIKPFCLTSLCKTSLPKLFKNHPPNLPSILFLTWCMYLYYKFYFKSSQTAPQRNRPTSSRTAMCGHWWCQALVEHAKLCSFWLLCQKYDIWHMTYVYIMYLYLHISIFIFYSRHTHIYADISENMSTIFICVVVERSSSFAGSRRFA